MKTNQVISQTATLTVTKTREAVGTKLRRVLDASGLPWSIDFVGGRMAYVVNGEALTAGEACDRYYPGGFAAAYEK